MGKILVVREKNDTRYFDVSTDELKYRAAYKILSERLELGYYYYEPQPLEERLIGFNYAELSDEDIASLPASIRDGIEASRDHEKKMISDIVYEYKREALFYKLLLEVVTLPVEEAIHYKHNKMSRIPTVWVLMNEISERQYQGWEIEDIESC